MKEDDVERKPQSDSGNCPICHYKHTARNEQTVKQLQNRLNRMIGQLNGIKTMLDDNRYCGDVLTQVAAVESALQSFGYMVLQNHLETCVVEEIKKDNTQILEEALDLIKKLK
ncbi:MAG: metal-sensing transcriptional repressor [Treponema sp.]